MPKTYILEEYQVQLEGRTMIKANLLALMIVFTFSTVGQAQTINDFVIKAEYDYRDRLRSIFEDSFETWISHSAQAEACLRGRLDEKEIEAVADQAAKAFYPGILNILKRRSYVDDLKSKVPLAKLKGRTGGSCLMAGQLADLSRLPMDEAIDAAKEN